MSDTRTQLHAYWEHLDALFPDIAPDDVLDGETPPQAVTSGPRPQALPWWKHPLAVAVGSAAAVLLSVGAVVLLFGGSEPDLADTTPPTTQTPALTTVPPAPTTVALIPDGRITAPGYGDVPSFVGVVEYHEHDPASNAPGWQATVEVRYAGPLRYEATVAAETGERLAFAGPGTVFFGDGTDMWINEADDIGPWELGFEPFRHLFFDSAWDEICGSSATDLGVAVVAGRSTTHVACSSQLEDYELWVDEESGVVLRMRGPIAIGDFTPNLARDGLFEFTAIEFGQVSTPGPPPPPPPLDAFPPFHMVRTTTDDHGWMQVETWYLDDETVSEEWIDASDEAMIGTFILIADGQLGECIAAEQQCGSVPLESDEYLSWPTNDIPLDLVAEHCAEVDEGTVAGRTARHFVCDGVQFMRTSYWQASTDPGAPGMSEHWYDTETKLSVKQAYPARSVETTLLDINPVFPADIFVYEELEFEATPSGIGSGDLAPNWTGPLVGGGTFDTAEHRNIETDQSGGSFVIVYDWFPGCGDVCIENLAEFQRLYETYGETQGTGDALTFVTVSEDTESETRRVLDRFDITVPTVHCGWDPDAVCLPDSPWSLWGNGVPSVTAIDPNGEVINVYMRPPINDELRDLLGLITGTG